MSKLTTPTRGIAPKEHELVTNGNAEVSVNGSSIAAQIVAARQQNELLMQSGNANDLPGLGSWIPAREAIGRNFLICDVTFNDSAFKDDSKYAVLTVVFEDEPNQKQTISAGGAYLLNQLRRMEAELTSHLWTIHELKQLRDKPVQKFNGLYPLVIDFAGRLDTSYVEADNPF